MVYLAANLISDFTTHIAAFIDRSCYVFSGCHATLGTDQYQTKRTISRKNMKYLTRKDLESVKCDLNLKFRTYLRLFKAFKILPRKCRHYGTHRTIFISIFTLRAEFGYASWILRATPRFAVSGNLFKCCQPGQMSWINRPVLIKLISIRTMSIKLEWYHIALHETSDMQCEMLTTCCIMVPKVQRL